MQYLPTRHHHLELRAGSEKVFHLLCSIHYLLEVVQEQQHLLLPQFPFQMLQERLTSFFPDAERLGDNGYNQRRIVYGS